MSKDKDIRFTGKTYGIHGEWVTGYHSMDGAGQHRITPSSAERSLSLMVDPDTIEMVRPQEGEDVIAECLVMRNDALKVVIDDDGEQGASDE